MRQDCTSARVSSICMATGARRVSTGSTREIGLNHGVTTAVDAGTTGFANFSEFRRTAIASSQARILAFVHISCLGLHTPFAEELVDIRYARPHETAAVVEQFSDVTVGVKIRVGAMTANHGNAALALALSAAESCGRPLMVHISSGADEAHILDRLRPGDILTHCFHGRENRMVAPKGEGFIPQVKAARERGIVSTSVTVAEVFPGRLPKRLSNITSGRTRSALICIAIAWMLRGS